MVVDVDVPVAMSREHDSRSASENLFDVAVQQFQIAADLLGLGHDMRRILSHWQR